MVERFPNAEFQNESRSLLVEHYLDGAIRLRQAATWNTFDVNLKGELPHRIIPVVDADVIRMFMAPAEETGYVDPFPGLQSGSATRREWDDPLTLVAAATAEFIFLTGKIPVLGQEVTKWNEELRIASPHLQDVEAMLYQIKMKIVEGLLSLEELEDEAIERLDPLLARSRGDADGGLSALVKALPNSLRELYLGPIYEAERWLRLRGDGILLKLEGLAEATTEVLEPDESLIERWREPLFRSLHRSHASGRDQARRQDPEDVRRRAMKRAERDARALASVTALNEAGLKLGVEHGWRAILISGDDHLHRVYARWVWETSGASLQPERYVLRRPLQYTPVLNVVSMSQDQSAADIFTKLTTALDLTVDLLLDQWEGKRNPYLLEHHWERHGKIWLKALDPKGIDQHLARCNDYWLEAINHINARNHPYLTRDYQRLFDRLRVAFDEPDARHELINHTMTVVDEIDAEHFWLVLDETIYELARIAKPMRMPFLVRTEFPGFLAAGGSVARFLYGEPESSTMIKHEAAELAELAKNIRDAPGVHATFLTAILAAASGSFARASRLMLRAQQLAANDSKVETELLIEMTYFRALIMRLNVKRVEDYRRARDVLLRELSRATGDMFRVARIKSEAAALELQWYATEAQNRALPAEQKAYLDRSGLYLAAARESLQWPVAPQASRYERELALQIVVNIIALNAYIKLAEENPDLESVRWAHQQFDALLNGAISDADYITELWWLAATWLVDSSQESANVLSAHCTRALAQLNLDEIPVGDHNDLKRIQAYLQGSFTTIES
jgi:hypothetical protein